MNPQEIARQLYIFNNFIEHVHKQRQYSNYYEIIGNDPNNYIGIHLATLTQQHVNFCPQELIETFPFSKKEETQLFFTQNPSSKLSIPDYAQLGLRYSGAMVLGIFGTNDDPEKLQKQEALELFHEEIPESFHDIYYQENSPSTYTELIIAKPKVLTLTKTLSR